jgi:hypothetical protein
MRDLEGGAQLPPLFYLTVCEIEISREGDVCPLLFPAHPLSCEERGHKGEVKPGEN